MYFTGIGTVVNMLAVVVGGMFGLAVKGGMKEHFQTALIHILGVATVFVGGSGALSGLFHVGEEGKLQTSGEVVMIIALVAGVLIGEFLDIEEKLERFGHFLKSKAGRAEDNRFVEGFVNASLVVCVGAMAVVGSLRDALSADPSTLYTKSILDGLIIIVFASTYGIGAIFSALAIGLLQGSVTLCAALVAPLFSAAVIENLSLIGSVLIFCVGANLAFDAKFRVANMLPALVVGGVLVSIL